MSRSVSPGVVAVVIAIVVVVVGYFAWKTLGGKGPGESSASNPQAMRDSMQRQMNQMQSSGAARHSQPGGP